MRTSGIHHVTIMARDAAANVRFYAHRLGLRLVKRTVNFDDPTTHHLYYGDPAGSPGSIVTFFPFATIAPGRRGVGEVSATALAIPAGSLDDWRERLAGRSIRTTPIQRPGETGAALSDHDGTALELIETNLAAGAWRGADGEIDPTLAIRGVHSVSLRVPEVGPTRDVLVGLLGFRETAPKDGRLRLTAGRGGPGAIVDLIAAGAGERPRPGAGSVHHVAFRAESHEALLAFRERIKASRMAVTELRDRMYFQSIYFREPGGVLFEIATDGPGFTRDEAQASLGEALRLPPWLKDRRAEIEATLPPLT